MIIERAKSLRQQIESLAETLEDDKALQVSELFPTWTIDLSYEVGARVRYEGILYKCLTSHTSQETWTPTAAPSLWAQVLIPDPETIPEWVQPESTNPYMEGDKVTHNGKTWVSNIDNNVWEPGVYGWDEV